MAGFADTRAERREHEQAQNGAAQQEHGHVGVGRPHVGDDELGQGDVGAQHCGQHDQQPRQAAGPDQDEPEEERAAQHDVRVDQQHTARGQQTRRVQAGQQDQRERAEDHQAVDQLAQQHPPRGVAEPGGGPPLPQQFGGLLEEPVGPPLRDAHAERQRRRRHRQVEPAADEPDVGVEQEGRAQRRVPDDGQRPQHQRPRGRRSGAGCVLAAQGGQQRQAERRRRGGEAEQQHRDQQGVGQARHQVPRPAEHDRQGGEEDQRLPAVEDQDARGDLVARQRHHEQHRPRTAAGGAQHERGHRRQRHAPDRQRAQQPARHRAGARAEHLVRHPDGARPPEPAHGRGDHQGADHHRAAQRGEHRRVDRRGQQVQRAVHHVAPRAVACPATASPVVASPVPASPGVDHVGATPAGAVGVARARQPVVHPPGQLEHVGRPVHLDRDPVGDAQALQHRRHLQLVHRVGQHPADPPGQVGDGHPGRPAKASSAYLAR
ncbi:hypothetical protein [Saccharothrix algeriensis]|uniref:Uncharacterized protein n=1 Tax=Saccharothrix algeriensis TaxID=173560 RepID=A0ABS2SFC8_9PSEU|nr:hypothetical protein [Saccharothrix algeriensis]MBM7814669.1 hypothetical protein [Saccharothrix algeriensis]